MQKFHTGAFELSKVGHSWTVKVEARGYLKFSNPPSRNLPATAAAGTSWYYKKETGGEIASPRVPFNSGHKRAGR
jgi:hypothetical protein